MDPEHQDLALFRKLRYPSLHGNFQLQDLKIRSYFYTLYPTTDAIFSLKDFDVGDIVF